MGEKNNPTTAAAGMVDLIRELIQQELIKEDNTDTCRIMACNPDGTYDITVLPDMITVLSSVKSISPENLKQGDYAYIYKFRNKLNNAIIIARVGGQGGDFKFVTPDALSESIANVTGGPFLPLIGGTLTGNLDVTPSLENKHIRVNSPTSIQRSAYSELKTESETIQSVVTPRAVLALSDHIGSVKYGTSGINLGTYSLSFPTLSSDAEISTDHVSGTNDGTYWTTITINGSTYSIGSGTGTDNNQTIKQGNVTFDDNAVINFIGASGSHITVTGDNGYDTMTFGVASGYSIPSDSDQTAWTNKYDKPSGGIPDSDIASASTWNAKYTKPAGGIPSEDVAFYYAGSSSKGGAATSANKLNTDAGSATQPVYFSNGIPVVTTYALNKTVPADAVFTDTNYYHTPVYNSGLKVGTGVGIADLYVPAANGNSATPQDGIVTSAAQTFAGEKTFADTLTMQSADIVFTRHQQDNDGEATIGAGFQSVSQETVYLEFEANSGNYKFKSYEYDSEEEQVINHTSTLQFRGSADHSYTFPDITGDVVLTNGEQTISGPKTFVGMVNIDGDGAYSEYGIRFTEEAGAIVDIMYTCEGVCYPEIVDPDTEEVIRRETLAQFPETGYTENVAYESWVSGQLNSYIPKSLLTTAGDMIYASAADNTPTRLAIGTAGQVLTVGSGGVPTWSSISVVDNNQTITAKNGSASTVTTFGANAAVEIVAGTNIAIATDSTNNKITISSVDTNYYPTAFTWTDGTTAGPTGSLTGTGMSAVSFGAIPSASSSTSGVVTTGTQTFAGDKTLIGNFTVTNTTNPERDAVLTVGGNYVRGKLVIWDGEDGASITLQADETFNNQTLFIPNEGDEHTIATREWVSDNYQIEIVDLTILA